MDGIAPFKIIYKINFDSSVGYTEKYYIKTDEHKPNILQVFNYFDRYSKKELYNMLNIIISIVPPEQQEKVKEFFTIIEKYSIAYGRERGLIFKKDHKVYFNETYKKGTLDGWNLEEIKLVLASYTKLYLLLDYMSAKYTQEKVIEQDFIPQNWIEEEINE